MTKSDSETLALYFSFFNEVGIIEQLSRALFEARLPDGFLASHFAVLNHLIRVRDGQTPLVLARAFQVPKTTMTHTLSVLEKHRLIEMRPNPKDGRSKCVWLTAAGRDFRNNAIASLGPDIAEFAKQFPPDRIEALVPGLTDIRQMLDAARDED
ncbi:MAG: MarR family winged helix-turn-helix transcriptional regulator [Alphaproteobacteria bacterium]|nr:MarR family winged helix-turn-helix transcriptional regulator [Alphaproteobacteria bacterium]